MTVHKQGGLTFWRIGRFGGSVYRVKATPKPARERMATDEKLTLAFEIFAVIALGINAGIVAHIYFA